MKSLSERIRTGDIALSAIPDLVAQLEAENEILSVQCLGNIAEHMVELGKNKTVKNLCRRIESLEATKADLIGIAIQQQGLLKSIRELLDTTTDGRLGGEVSRWR